VRRAEEDYAADLLQGLFISVPLSRTNQSLLSAVNDAPGGNITQCQRWKDAMEQSKADLFEDNTSKTVTDEDQGSFCIGSTRPGTHQGLEQLVGKRRNI